METIQMPRSIDVVNYVSENSPYGVDAISYVHI